MKPRTTIAIKLIASHILSLVLLLFLNIIINTYQYILLSITQLFIIIIYYSGYWEFFGICQKRIILFLSESLLIIIFIYKYDNGLIKSYNIYIYTILSLALLYLTFLLLKILQVVFKKSKHFIDITFPCKTGVYLITDGGNSKTSRLMNYHYYARVHKKNKTNNAMLFAVDIVSLNGCKANWLPKANESYPIFDKNVYCPMEGTVVKVENDIIDNQPFSEILPYNTGNTVVINNNNYFFLIGHLKKGSITVRVGDTLMQGDYIGKVGNSGWTERPHIHMQLMESKSEQYWSGKGVEIRYENKLLIKNRIIKID